MERRFIGALIKKGNKARARRIFYDVMSFISAEHNSTTSKILDEICSKVAPILDFYRIKKGASVVNHPRLISEQKAKSLAVHWIVNSALLRSERTVENKLKFEILDLLNDQGKAFSKRDEFHKKAVSTRYALTEKVSPDQVDEEEEERREVAADENSYSDIVREFIAQSKTIEELFDFLGGPFTA